LKHWQRNVWHKTKLGIMSKQFTMQRKITTNNKNASSLFRQLRSKYVWQSLGTGWIKNCGSIYMEQN